MKTNIVQVGNSIGVILPSNLLKKLNLSLKSSVNIEIDGESIIIRPEPRQGWAEAAMQMHAIEDDKMLLPEIFKDEDLSDLSW